jgi:methyl-accepting chemotaxis protein
MRLMNEVEETAQRLAAAAEKIATRADAIAAKAAELKAVADQLRADVDELALNHITDIKNLDERVARLENGD